MENSLSKISYLKERVLCGLNIPWEEALFLINLEGEKEIELLAQAAGEVQRWYSPGGKIDLCSLINAKSGRCTEDCAFCAQTARHKTEAKTFPLVSEDAIVEAASHARENGAHRFCIVVSGHSLSTAEFNGIIRAFSLIKKSVDIILDGSLGFLNDDRIRALKEVGVRRINHNLETSGDYYPHVVTTHSFADRVQTVRRLKEAGFEVCSGGIIGMGESREDRLKLAFKLLELEVDCVPLNILNPIKGTPLESQTKLSPDEIIKTISCFRFILPKTTIKLAGGREFNLGSHQERALKAGVDGLIIGGYLTTSGSPPAEDLALAQRAGFSLS